MLLFLDNYDSFSFNLIDYFAQLGVECEHYYNDNAELLKIDTEKYIGAILSPGPCRPSDSQLLMPFIDQYHKQLPMLGVCLGHQALGEYFGAKLNQSKEPMHGFTSPIYFEEEAGLFKNLMPGFKAMRYHSLLLQSPPPNDLKYIAHTKENEVMALQHKTLPLWGVQFHPESILTTYGIIILRNWIESIAE